MIDLLRKVLGLNTRTLVVPLAYEYWLVCVALEKNVRRGKVAESKQTEFRHTGMTEGPQEVA